MFLGWSIKLFWGAASSETTTLKSEILELGSWIKLAQHVQFYLSQKSLHPTVQAVRTVFRRLACKGGRGGRRRGHLWKALKQILRCLGPPHTHTVIIGNNWRSWVVISLASFSSFQYIINTWAKEKWTSSGLAHNWRGCVFHRVDHFFFIAHTSWFF